MSVLVNGMEMPIGCNGWGTSCPLLQWGLGDVYCRITHRHIDSIEDSFKYAKERPADCPLVKVTTPHGDLISREWLIDIALHLLNTAKNDDIANGVKWLWQYIIDAPTIIPPEEGE